MYWYAMYCRSQFERPVAAELNRRGIESYLPLLACTRRWSDRQKHTDTPAFPGYVFVHIHSHDRIRALAVNGAVRLLGLHGEAERIPDGQIDQVRLMLSAQSAGTVVAACSVPAKGQAVHITGGPLAGLFGTCERIRTHSRVVVSLPLLNQAITAEVDLADLAIVQGGATDGGCRDTRNEVRPAGSCANSD